MTECACALCVDACRRHPGWFAPGEAEKAAEFLGVPFEEFKKSLILDHCSSRTARDAPYVYSPRKVGVDREDQAIRESWNQSREGVCVFLKNDRCSIHAVKPFECARVLVCKFQRGVRDGLEKKWIAAGAPLGMRPEMPDDDDDIFWASRW